MKRFVILASTVALVSVDVAMAKTPCSELHNGRIPTFEKARKDHAKNKKEGPDAYGAGWTDPISWKHWPSVLGGIEAAVNGCGFQKGPNWGRLTSTAKAWKPNGSRRKSNEQHRKEALQALTAEMSISATERRCNCWEHYIYYGPYGSDLHGVFKAITPSSEWWDK